MFFAFKRKQKNGGSCYRRFLFQNVAEFSRVSSYVKNIGTFYVLIFIKEQLKLIRYFFFFFFKFKQDWF